MKRHLVEGSFEFPSNKEIKYSSHHDDHHNNDDLVSIRLIDFIPNNDNQQQLLIQKFGYQQKGKSKWLHRRESFKYYTYIPVEFSVDKYFVLNFIKTKSDYNSDLIRNSIDEEILYDEEVLRCLTQYCIFHGKEKDLFEILFPMFLEKEKRHVALKLYADFYEKLEPHMFFDELGIEITEDEILLMVKQNGLVLSQFPEYQSSLIVQEAALQNPAVLDILTGIQVSKELFLNSIDRRKEFGSSFIIPDHLINDREVVLKSVEKYGLILDQVGDEFKSDRDIILASVKSNGCALRYADKKFQNDEEIVREALSQNGQALKSLGDDIKSDRELVLLAIRSNSLAFNYISEGLQKDKEILLEALKNPYADIMEMAQDSGLLENRELALQIVKKNGALISYLPKNIWEDREILLNAIRNINGKKSFFSYCKGEFGEFLFSQIGKELSVCLECLKKDVETLLYACDAPFKEQVMLEGLRLYKGKAKNYLPYYTSLTGNVEFFQKATMVYGMILSQNTELAQNREIVLEAIRQDTTNIGFYRGIKDKEMILALIQNINCLRYSYMLGYRDLIQKYFEDVLEGQSSYNSRNLIPKKVLEKRIEHEYFGAKLN